MVVAIEMVDQHHQDGKRCDGADGHIQDDQGPYLPIGRKNTEEQDGKASHYGNGVEDDGSSGMKQRLGRRFFKGLSFEAGIGIVLKEVDGIVDTDSYGDAGDQGCGRAERDIE